jgi:ParB-like nuclease domain
MARTKKEKPAALKPKSGWHGRDDIEKLLAERPKNNGTQETQAAPVTELRRKDILAAAAGVFQWRLCERNEVRSDAHIKELVRALRTTGSAFDPLLVFQAGDKYFVIDGHHRLRAYEAADWNKPVPVEVFEGSLEEARLAALDSNRKDKLAMSREEKTEAAWQLVKEDTGLSKQQLVSRGLVSNGTIGSMRAKWRELKNAGDDTLLQMTWMQALRWTPGGSAEWKDDEWRERKVQELIERLVAVGIAKEFGKHPDIVAEALCRIDPDLPDAVMAQLCPDDVIERMQALKAEDYHRDPWEPPDAKDMHKYKL